jgi:AMP deaminase
LGSSQVARQDPSSDDEEPYSQSYDNDEASSEESWDKNKDDKEPFPSVAAFGPGPETAGDANPSDGLLDGMLDRDIQRKTTYYDYAAEKQMSHADAKLFYQRSKLEAQKTGGSNWGSQNSLQNSPVITATKSFPNMGTIGTVEQSYVRRSDSFRSMQSGQSSSQ